MVTAHKLFGLVLGFALFLVPLMFAGQAQAASARAESLVFGGGSVTGVISSVTYNSSGQATSIVVTDVNNNNTTVDIDPPNQGMTDIVTRCHGNATKVTVVYDSLSVLVEITVTA